MKKIFIFSVIVGATLAGAVPFDTTFPQYWESVKGRDYSTIVLHDSTNATYFTRLTRDDGSVWYYLDAKATWGHFPRESWAKRFTNATDFIWINTARFRFDYLIEKGNLVEYDKTGRQRAYVRVENDNNRPQQSAAPLPPAPQPGPSEGAR